MAPRPTRGRRHLERRRLHLRYRKKEVADAAVLCKAPAAAGDGGPNGCTDRVAAAYAWFGVDVHALLASGCQASTCALVSDGFFSSGRARLRNVVADSRGCGRGLLDNLRSQCGVVTDWQYTDIWLSSKGESGFLRAS